MMNGFDGYTLVTVVVFGLAGSLILALIIADHAHEYQRLQKAVRKTIGKTRAENLKGGTIK